MEVKAEAVTKKGVVVAGRLNIRTGPGANFKVKGRLLLGTKIDILEEKEYAGATWFKTGEDSWVHSGWVRTYET